MAGGAVIASGIESGSLDIGWSNIVSIIMSHDKGFAYKFLTPGAFRDSTQGIVEHKLLVNKDLGIQNPADLEGKKVAINTLGNINELIFEMWADKNNVTDVTLVEIPFPQMEVTLENNRVAGAIVIEPFVTLCREHNVTRVLDDSPYDVVSEELMIASWFAKKSWVKENPKKVESFRNAINVATEYIQKNPEEVPKILSKHTKLDQELVNKATLPIFKEEIDEENIQVLINSSYKYGFIDEKFNAEKIILNQKN